MAEKDDTSAAAKDIPSYTELTGRLVEAGRRAKAAKETDTPAPITPIEQSPPCKKCSKFTWNGGTCAGGKLGTVADCDRWEPAPVTPAAVRVLAENICDIICDALTDRERVRDSLRRTLVTVAARERVEEAITAAYAEQDKAARAVIDSHADEEDLCMECGCEQCEATRAAVAHLKAVMKGGGK